MNSKLLAIGAVVVVIIMVAAAFVFLGNGGNDELKGTIKQTKVPPVNQEAFIQQGLIDGGVSWEPYCSDSISNGTAKALVWSDEIWPEHPCCVIVVDKSYALANPGVVKALLKAHIVATDWIKDTLDNTGSSDYDALITLGMGFSRRNETVVESAMEHIKVVYEIKDKTIDYLNDFVNQYIANGLILNDTLTQRGYSSVQDFIDTYVNITYLDDAKDVQPVSAETPLTTVKIGYLNGDLHQYARVVADSPVIGNLIYGNDKSIFENFGIQTEKPEGMPEFGYAAGGPVMDAFAQNPNDWQDNVIDVGYLGAPPSLLKHVNLGIDTMIVSLVNQEGSALIVKPGINKVTDLDGMTIGQPDVSSIQYLLLLAIAEEYHMKVVAA